MSLFTFGIGYACAPATDAVWLFALDGAILDQGANVFSRDSIRDIRWLFRIHPNSTHAYTKQCGSKSFLA
jgi:hypothetical protein